MSERQTSVLERFYDENLPGGDSDLGNKSQVSAVINAAHGSLLDRQLEAGIDAIQGSNVAPIAVATTLAASTLASAVAPVVAAAHDLYRGNRAPSHAVVSKQATKAVMGREIIFRLQPGGAIEPIAAIEAPIMGVSIPVMVDRIEAASGISPNRVTDLPIGQEIIVPLDPEVAIIPKGSNLSLMAEQYGDTLSEIEGFNPQIKNPNLVYAGESIRVKGSPNTSKAASKRQVVNSTQQHSTTIHSKPRNVKTSTTHKVLPAPTHQTTTGAHSRLSNTTKTKPVITIQAKKPARVVHTVKKTRTHLDSGSLKSFGEPRITLVTPLVHAERQTNVAVGKIGMKVFGLLARVENGMFKEYRGKPRNHYQHITKKSEQNVPASEINVVRCNPNSPTLAGGDNTEKVAYNYFVTCEGYTPAQASGIVGNLVQESNVRPLSNEVGAPSRNPYSSGEYGWGIAQWTPGSKALSVAGAYGIKAPIYLLQTQLEMVNAEMNNVSPTGNRNIARTIRMQTDPSAAAELFEGEFEEGSIAFQGGGQLSSRQTYAREALANYGGSTTTNKGPNVYGPRRTAIGKPKKVMAVAATVNHSHKSK